MGGRGSLGLLDISIEPRIGIHELLRIYVVVNALPFSHASLQLNCILAELVTICQHLHVLLLANAAAIVKNLLVELLNLHRSIFIILFMVISSKTGITTRPH